MTGSDGPSTQRRLDLQDLLFGGFLLVFAVAVTAATWKLRVGTAASMGPGYMPRVLSVGIAAFGVYFVVRGAVKPFHAIDPPRPRAVLGILAAVALFALLAPTAGLAVAALATIVAAGLASAETRFLENLLFGVAMAVAVVLLFVKALSLPVPAWPWG